MVNSPKIRHSKPNRDPVTIDLDAEPATSSTTTAGQNDDRATTQDRAASAKPADGPSVKPPFSATSAARESAAPGDTPPVGADKPSTRTTPPSPAQPAPQARRGGGSTVAAGILGAVIAVGGAAALQFAGVLPAPGGAEVEGLRTEIEAVRTQISAAPAADSSARLDQLAAGLTETRTQLEALNAAAGQGTQSAGAVEERFKALEAAVAAAGQGGTPVDLAPIAQRMDGFDAAIAEAKQASANAAAALEQRIAALEAQLADLGGKVAEQAEQPNAALAIAASGLKATIDRGDPFMTELETYASIAPQSAQVEALRGLAATGVPPRTAIDDAFPAAANAMIAAAASRDPDAGFLDRLMSSAQSLVQVRPVGMVEGDDAAAIVARMEVALKKGDYAGAVAQYETLPDPAKVAGAEFIAKVKARQAADGLIEAILSSALKA